MKLRKLVSFVLIIVMLAAVAGCSGTSKPSTTEAPSAAGKTEGTSGTGTAPADYDVSIATGGTAGVYYIIGAGISQLAEKFAPNLKITVSNTGASTENVRLLGDGTVNFAILQPDSPYFAARGEREYTPETKVDNIRGVYAGHRSFTQCIVREDSGINAISELKGKTVAISPAGSPTVYFHRAVLEAVGLKEGDYKEVYMTYGEMGEAVKNKVVDASFIYLGIPASPILDLESTTKIKILGLTAEEQKSITDKYPYITHGTVPKGAYKCVAEDILTIAALGNLVCRSDVPDDVVYQMVKLIAEHPDEIAALHVSGKEWDLADAHEGLAIPLHPGAEKYYKEKGIIK